MITIRRFEQEDQKSVQSLIHGIMSLEFGDDQSAYPSEDIQYISRHYGALGEGFFVAQNSSKIIGTVAIKKEDDRTALLRRLFVDPAYRKQQIGLKLIDKALKFCADLGYEEVVFRTTSRMVAAARICQKRGFVKRATLAMGPIELWKFTLSLRDGVKRA